VEAFLGRILIKLRLAKGRPDDSKGRGWKVTGAELQKRLAAFGLADSQKLMAHDGTTAHDDGTSRLGGSSLMAIKLKPV
jgi:hypothetical protein